MPKRSFAPTGHTAAGSVEAPAAPAVSPESPPESGEPDAGWPGGVPEAEFAGLAEPAGRAEFAGRAGPELPPPGPPGDPRAGSATELTEYTIVRRRSDRPRRGWRRVVYAATGGTVNPGIGTAELRRQDFARRIRRQLPGPRQIAVVSMKGGVGKTTVTAVLGLTFAEHRGDRVIALDANPDAGTLADRLTGRSDTTVRDLLNEIGSVRSLSDVSRFTALAGRLQVLASEQDPERSEAFNRAEYERACAVLARFYNIVVTDSGTGMVHSAMAGTLALAHSLVVVGSLTVDGASRASKTLDWLVAHGFADLAARSVVVLSRDRSSPEIDAGRLRAHFATRVRGVVEIPHDPHLATGARIELGAVTQATSDAFLEVAALVADEFGGLPLPRP